MREDFEYYQDHQGDIVKGHIGETVVIKDKQIIGYFKDVYEAVGFMRGRGHAMGTYLNKILQSARRQCPPYSQSRVGLCMSVAPIKPTAFTISKTLFPITAFPSRLPQ
jgi:hypothetical protein